MTVFVPPHTKVWNLGILLFNEVEVLDFAGPFEVFSIVRYLESDKKPFNVKTVAQTKNLIIACNGLKIQPYFDFSNAPHFDILIVPGGYGAGAIEVNNQKLLDFIITSGGISAGINMSFHIVKKLLGEEVAKVTARRMEYDIDI